MSIQDWGAIGEILGAIGVIVTLLYLATQLRQNTKAMKSATVQTYNQTAMNISDFMSDHARMFTKQWEEEELSPEEELRFNMFAMKLFYQMESIFLHYREGTVDRDLFDSRMRGFRRAMEGPSMMDAWQQYRDWDLADAFVRYAEEHVLAELLSAHGASTGVAQGAAR